MAYAWIDALQVIMTISISVYTLAEKVMGTMENAWSSVLMVIFLVVIHTHVCTRAHKTCSCKAAYVLHYVITA